MLGGRPFSAMSLRFKKLKVDRKSYQFFFPCPTLRKYPHRTVPRLLVIANFEMFSPGIIKKKKKYLARRKVRYSYSNRTSNWSVKGKSLIYEVGKSEVGPGGGKAWQEDINFGRKVGGVIPKINRFGCDTLEEWCTFSPTRSLNTCPNLKIICNSCQDQWK